MPIQTIFPKAVLPLAFLHKRRKTLVVEGGVDDCSDRQPKRKRLEPILFFRHAPSGDEAATAARFMAYEALLADPTPSAAEQAA